MKTILITGAAGFIGSNFIHYMLKTYKDSLQLVNLDVLTYAGNLENLEGIDNYSNYSFEQGDIADKECVARLFQHYKFDSVVHFAAESHVDRSILDSTAFIRTNITGTQVLLDCAREFGIERFVHVSTDEVYGSLQMDDPAFTEQHDLKPNSPYAASKASSDLIVRSYYKTYGLPVLITRCSNNYGPYQFPEKLIPLMVSNALENKTLPVYGTGQNVRDWIYVDDHCQAIDVVLQRGRVGEIYNAGGNSEMKNLDLVKHILRYLNKDESLIEFVEDRKGHDFRYAIDFSKLKNECGWQPQISFEEGIKKTVDWYLANPQWLANVKSGDYMEYYNRQYNKKDV